MFLVISKAHRPILDKINMFSMVLLSLGTWQLFLFFTYADNKDIAKDCVDLLEKGFKQNGVYLINPDDQEPFQVFCDQNTNGGGWIVFQKRFDGSEDFHRNWSDYKNGFGNVTQEFWLGNDKIHRLTNQHHELLVELEAHDNSAVHAIYSYFSIGSEENGYELHLGSYTGSAEDIFTYHKNVKFSTKDVKNDEEVSVNCSQMYRSGWWYKKCSPNSLAVDSNGSSNGPTSPRRFTSMKIRGLTGTEWDYSIDLIQKAGFTHATISNITELNELSACWWIRLNDTQSVTVFSIGDSSQSSVAFSIQGTSLYRVTVNRNDGDIHLPEINVFDTHWHFMCIRGSVFKNKWKFAVDGVRTQIQSLKMLRIPRGSLLRIGSFSQLELSNREEKESVIGELTHFNIWDAQLNFVDIFKMTRGCHAQTGNFISWSVIQFWLHGSVNKTSPSSCTSKDNIHWSLSSANGSEVADDSLLWRGKVEGDGVDLDTNVISLQGAGHVTLGRFHDNCPGNPSMCEDGFTVSFWMKYGVKFASCILGQNELYHEAIESMMSAVTPSRSKWIRCYHAKSDGYNAQAFHSRCDNKGPTVTLVRVREFVFGGFLDQNWGGPNGIRSISSDSAFLFNINNALELKPFKLNIKKSQKQIAALYDPTTGPVFGQDDLRVTFDNRSIPLYGASHIGHAYELPQGFNGTDQVDGMKLFAGTSIFSWDDLEVFYYDVPHASLGASDPATVQNSAFNSSSEKVSLDYSAQSAPVGSASEWCAYYNDEHQWLEASIGYDPDHNNFELKALKSGGKSGMTWYLLNSSTDGKIWNEFKNGERIPEGKGVSFIGNLRYVRFIPESWDSRICMKVEVDAGKNKSQVAFNKLTASSELCMSPAYFARLHLTGECFSAWCPRPRSQDPHPWLSVNLNSLNQILFVATQGSDNGQDKTHVLSYYLSYVHEEDGTIRNYTENGNLKIFEGNWDGSTVVKNAILNPFQTKSLTFHIVDSKSDQCCLRVEIYGPRCQQPLGMENGAISDAQITASSWHTPSDPKAYVPSRARLHTQHNEDPYLAGGWVAAPDDVYPWLQVHLGNETFKVTRVATQGRNFYKQWVKKYKLQYSQDGVSFNYYKAYGETKHKSFWAKADSDIVAYRDLDPPIRARFIRFRPTLWHDFATMRVELYGCPLDCSPKPLGMENGAISDSQITASSENGLKWPAKNARLNYPQGGAWAPKLNPDEWLQIDFLNYRTSVTSVATQGRSIGNITQWVSTYRLQYSNLEYYFKYFKEDGTNEAKVFSGNIDGNSTVSHDLNPPIIARYVRFLPLTYHGLIAMRVELYYGCVQASEAEDDTIVSWRGTNSNSEDKAFELKQVNDLLTPHHQLSVTAANETYTLYIPTVPRTWHHVTFTWSKAWGIKFYQDGALVAGTGRSEKSVFVTKGESSGLFIIGNRVLTSGRSGISNFQIQGLTVWPRLVSLAQLKHELETVTCHVMDQCLKQSYNDDFDWSFGISCTETYHTGPCGEHVLSGEVRRSFSNAAFNRKTEQYDRTSFSRMVVDGDFNSRSELGQVEETWWMVDLGREGLVTGVRLVFKLASNGNNTASRLDIIIVHETGKIEQSLCEAVNKSDIIANEVAYKVTSCGKPLLGRFVKVEVTMEVHVKCKKLTTCPPSPVMNLYEVEVLMAQSTGFNYINSASPRVKGEKSRLMTRYILPRYNCLAFSYHMQGSHMGRLNVYFKCNMSPEILLWRLYQGKSNNWHHGEIPIQTNVTFQIIFEGVVGNGNQGDLAIDNVMFTTNSNCSIIPDAANPSSVQGFRSDIIGHIPAYQAHLESWLTSVNFHGKLWKPCYSTAKDGWDSGIFHEKCDGKGATLTIARFNNTIFGGFSDHSWGGHPEGYRISTKSFLFRFDKKIGQLSEDQVLGMKQVHKLIQWKVDKGPVFGVEELAFSSNMKQAITSKLMNYTNPAALNNNYSSFEYLLVERYVSLHAVEVLTIGDTLCQSQCPLYQYCDEVKGWCKWDSAFQKARFCGIGNWTSYWPLDSHVNMVNLGGDEWGMFEGAVSTTQGARLGAVHTSGGGAGAVITLGEIIDKCLTEPSSCKNSNGFSLTLWLRHSTTYLNHNTVQQRLLTIGDNENIVFKIFQLAEQTEEHLAVELSLSSRNCLYIFPVPKFLWSLFAFVWNTTDLNIYRDGVKVDRFLDTKCVAISDFSSQRAVVSLQGDAMFDDLRIWSRTLEAKEIEGMFTCLGVPPWTCSTSDWTESMKTEGWSKCPQPNALLNGLIRGENGGLEDYIDRLEGAMCCSPPPKYKDDKLRCHRSGYYLNNRNELRIECHYGSFLQSFYRQGSSPATLDVVTTSNCCRLRSAPSSYHNCYFYHIGDFNRPGLAKCEEHYYIAGLHIGACRQLYCINRIKCCRMKTDEREDRNLEISLKVKLLDETWNATLTNASHIDFIQLEDKMKKKITDIYDKANKKHYLETILTPTFTPGSVIASFSMIFNVPQYDLISPLLEVINKTVGPNESNYLGDMGIHLMEVNPINVYGKSLQMTVTVANSSTFQLQWQFAEDDPEYGTFQGYQVLYRKISEITDEFLLSNDIKDNITQAWFFDAEECELYEFKVRAYSLEGYGKLSEAVNGSIPCKAIQNITATAITYSTMRVDWSPVKGSLFTAYNVTYSITEASLTRYQVVERSNSWVDLVNLRGMTLYSMKVGLMLEGGYTLWSEAVMSATPEGAPNAPPGNVTSYNLSSTSIYVTWSPVQGQFLHGILRAYQVFYRKASDTISPPKNISFKVSSLSARISNLDKFTVYSVWVKAVTIAAGPGSIIVNVTTGEDVPSLPPSNLTAFNLSSTVIRVVWEPIATEHINGLLLGYHVTTQKLSRVKRSVTMETVDASSLSVDLRGLSKFSQYRILINGFTSKGDGAAAEIKSWTDEDIPESPPTNLSARNNGSMTVDVYWYPVTQEGRNGIILGYSVLLFDAWGGFLQNATVMNSSHLFYQFHDLEAWTNYSVKVKAFTSKGTGPLSSSFVVQTAEDVPLVAPTNITGHNTSSTSILVAWQPVSPKEKNIRGILYGYRVYYIPRETSRPSVLKNVTVDVPTTYAQLANLYKYTLYDIHVTVRTRWDGPKSETISVSTDEGIPDSPPTNVSAHSNMSTVLDVVWYPVIQEDQNGIILGYQVILLDTWGEFLQNVTIMNSNQLYCQLKDLEPWVNRSVKVSAFTSKGNGPYSSSVIATFNEDVPLVVPANFTGHNTSSTSILVAWKPISPKEKNIRGLHRGYSIFYLPRDTSRPSVEMSVAVDVNATHAHLTNLYKYTLYEIYVTVRTRWNGPKSETITVSTDEGVPDLPPADVTAKRLGKTDIKVRWGLVPPGFRCGIITGYRITYNSSQSNTSSIEVPSDASEVILTSLAKFTFYFVYVQAHTIKGNGPAHYLKVATDMGVPNQGPPGLTADNRKTTHSVMIRWQPLPPSDDYGVLAGYRVRYQLAKLGDIAVSESFRKELVTSPGTNQVLLENLELYGTYSVWVSAFTFDGHGPASFTLAETCRCNKRLTTNWRQLPPYVSENNADLPLPDGILASLISKMAVTCCQSCETHGESFLDFSLDGDKGNSKKPSDAALREAISEKTEFHFPMPGSMDQEKFGAEHGYWPLVQTPGVAYIVNTGDSYTPSDALNDTLFECWAALLLVFATSLLAGFIMWILESVENRDQFPRSITRGPGEGFWWAFVTMTTVGYGDRYAVSPVARIFTVLWMLIGLATQSLFVATVTMSLVSKSLDADYKLYGNKVAAIQDSFEYRFGLRRNALVNPDNQYTTYEEIANALLDGEVTGALIDAFVLGNRKDLFENPSLRIIKVFDYSSAYGLVLSGEAKKLRTCFGKFAQSHKKEIFQIIESHVESVEESSIPLAVERTTGLFDIESSMFQATLISSSVLLLVFLVVGLVWELAKRLKIRRTVATDRDRLKLLMQNTKSEMNGTVEGFTTEIKAVVEELKSKHSEQKRNLIKTLKSKQQKGISYKLNAHFAGESKS